MVDENIAGQGKDQQRPSSSAEEEEEDDCWAQLVADAPHAEAKSPTEPKKSTKHPPTTLGDFLRVSKKAPQAASRTDARASAARAGGNALDSSRPSLLHKGKTRVAPKKPTRLKKTIISQRADDSTRTVECRTGNATAFACCTSERLDAAALQFLAEVKRFQDRLWAKDPIKAHAKRRILCGFREVSKAVQRGDAACVVLSKDIEFASGPGGTADQLAVIESSAAANAIPVVVVAASRVRLARAVNKHQGTVACVAVLNYDGAQELFKTMTTIIAEGKRMMSAIHGHIDQTSLFA